MRNPDAEILLKTSLKSWRESGNHSVLFTMWELSFYDLEQPGAILEKQSSPHQSQPASTLTLDFTSLSIVQLRYLLQQYKRGQC